MPVKTRTYIDLKTQIGVTMRATTVVNFLLFALVFIPFESRKAKNFEFSITLRENLIESWR